MSLVPKAYLNSVVALELPTGTSDRPYQCIGTGFLAGFESGNLNDKGEKLHQIFLFTNRHTLEGKSSMTVRFNAVGGTTSKRYTLALSDSNSSPLWVQHPDLRVDVAAVPIYAGWLLENQIESWFFPEQLMAFSGGLSELGIAPGDHIFVLGFPLGIAGLERNYAVVRGGVIARLDQEILTSDKLFLIDATIFQGNSGGPVIIQPTSDCLVDGKPIESAFLIGMVKSYLPYQEEAVSLQTGQTKVVFTENSGLALVIPVDLLRETVAPMMIKSKAALPPISDGAKGDQGVPCTIPGR